MAEEARGKRVYRNPLDDLPDQYLFFGLFLVGAAAIWWLKDQGVTQGTVTFAPLGLMVLYAVISVVTKRYRLREDKVGDNIYYLGFLFTLVSLAFALYAYRSDESGAASIITNFGIAISTTIVGLAGRVFFNQMREDPYEYEREARYSLAEASNKMRAQLGDIAAEASMFKRKLLQVVEEGAAEIAGNSTRAMEENAKGFAATTANMTEKVNAAFDTFVDQSTRLNGIATNTVAALEGLLRRIEQVEVSPQLFAAKFDPIMQLYATAAEETTKRNRGHAKDMERLRELIETSTEAADALRESIGKSDRGVSEYIVKFGDGLEKSVGAASKLGTSISAATNALTSQTEAQRTAVTGLATLLETSSRSLQGLVKELESNLAAHHDVMRQLRSTLEGDVRIATEHREAVAKVLEDSRGAAADVGSALVSLTKTLAENVGAR